MDFYGYFTYSTGADVGREPWSANERDRVKVVRTNGRFVARFLVHFTTIGAVRHLHSTFRVTRRVFARLQWQRLYNFTTSARHRAQFTAFRSRPIPIGTYANGFTATRFQYVDRHAPSRGRIRRSRLLFVCAGQQRQISIRQARFGVFGTTAWRHVEEQLTTTNGTF